MGLDVPSRPRRDVASAGEILSMGRCTWGTIERPSMPPAACGWPERRRSALAALGPSWRASGKASTADPGTGRSWRRGMPCRVACRTAVGPERSNEVTAPGHCAQGPIRAIALSANAVDRVPGASPAAWPATPVRGPHTSTVRHPGTRATAGHPAGSARSAVPTASRRRQSASRTAAAGRLPRHPTRCWVDRQRLVAPGANPLPQSMLEGRLGCSDAWSDAMVIVNDPPTTR